VRAGHGDSRNLGRSFSGCAMHRVAQRQSKNYAITTKSPSRDAGIYIGPVVARLRVGLSTQSFCAALRQACQQCSYAFRVRSSPESDSQVRIEKIARDRERDFCPLPALPRVSPPPIAQPFGHLIRLKPIRNAVKARSGRERNEHLRPAAISLHSSHARAAISA